MNYFQFINLVKDATNETISENMNSIYNKENTRSIIKTTSCI